nr:solute carrier family 35 member F6 [Zootoca vivipara]
MAWTKYQLFLAGLMLVTGSINTLSAKWADRLSARGCNATSEEHTFQHPFLQVLPDGCCLLPCDENINSEILYVVQSPDYSQIESSSVCPTPSNIQQRGRGVPDPVRTAQTPLFSPAGDLLIIMAQVIVAIQMVLEQKFVYKHNVHPLQAVGTEGLFGFLILSLLLVPMYYIPAGSFGSGPRRVLEDALDAFCQIGRAPLIALALLGNISSIAFFNFAGISVTKEISATTRMVLDSLRTVVIWAVSLAVGWEVFHGLQILGFLILLLGAAIYNGLHQPLLARLPWRRAAAADADADREGLLAADGASINGDS